MSELKPMTAHRAIYFMERFKKEEKLLGPNEQAAVDYVIAMLEAQDAQPAQAGQVLTDDALWELWNAQGCDDMNQSEAMKFARAIEQAVLAKRVPQWLPISTAPMDGTEILLSNGETVAQGNWLHAEPYMRERRDIDGRYIDQDEFDGYDGWIDQTGGMQPDPTHWMPLPPPPGIVGEKGGA